MQEISKVKEIATISKLVKPVFTIIDGIKFVIVDGTPIEYRWLLYILFSTVSERPLKNRKLVLECSFDMYQKFKKDGFIIPDEFSEYYIGTKLAHIARGEDFFAAEIWKFVVKNFSTDTKEIFEILEDIEYQHSNYDKN
jgi:hypothetical protein